MKRIVLGALAIGGLALISAFGTLTAAQDTGQGFAGDQPAPAFPEGLDWLNVPGPLTWEALRGKVVILDFWTYGCINCIHIIPDLKRLEAEYPDELVVIGVHSAKFENEGDTENIRQIIQRYEVEHPVVNDSDFVVWRTWGVRAWPTVAIVDPDGNLFGGQSGEGVYDAFKPIVEGMVRQFDAEGKINRDPIELALETAARPASLLAFPGKVTADTAGRRLFISDTNHNRIVITDLDTYEVLNIVGGIEAGSVDGGYAEARFDKPQGTAISDDGNTLYVADTENQTLRAVDLVGETVTTVAGTGEQVYVRRDPDGAPGIEMPLNSPWDVEFVDGIVYIAMAGPHQLWRYDTTDGAIYWHSGNLRENIVDGAHGDAQLAQPSGLTTDGEVLYFADSEASGVRISDIDLAGGVRTIVGTGLFDFGDVDGVGDEVRLQHALGVAYIPGEDVLYVADTYNSKIKRIDPKTRESVGVAGDVTGGYRDGDFSEARFDEPGGLSYAADQHKLYVADTNNHVIRVIDLAAQTVDTVQFANPEALQAGRDTVVMAPGFTGDQAGVALQTSAPGDGAITLDVILPEGYKLNDVAPFTAEWHPDGDVVQIDEADLVTRIVEPPLPVQVPVTLSEGEGELAVDLSIYYCEAVNESLCFVDRVSLSVPVSVSAGGDGVGLRIEHTIEPPEIEGF